MDKLPNLDTGNTKLSRKDFLRLAGTSAAFWAMRTRPMSDLERLSPTEGDKYDSPETMARLEKYGLNDFADVAKTSRRIFRNHGFIPFSHDPMFYYPTIAHMGANLDEVNLDILTSGWDELPWSRQETQALWRVSTMEIGENNSQTQSGARIHLQEFAKFFRTQSIFLPRRVEILSAEYVAQTGVIGLAGRETIYLSHPDQKENFFRNLLHETRHYFRENFDPENRKFLNRKKYAAGLAEHLGICEEIFEEWLALPEDKVADRPIISFYESSASGLESPNPMMLEATQSEIVALAKSSGLIQPGDNFVVGGKTQLSKLLNIVGHRFFKRLGKLDERGRTRLIREDPLARMYITGSVKEFPNIGWVVVENAMDSISHILFMPPLNADENMVVSILSPLFSTERRERAFLAHVYATTGLENPPTMADIRKRLGLDPHSIPALTISASAVAGLGIFTAGLYCVAGAIVIRDKIRERMKKRSET